MNPLHDCVHSVMNQMNLMNANLIFFIKTCLFMTCNSFIKSFLLKKSKFYTKNEFYLLSNFCENPECDFNYDHIILFSWFCHYIILPLCDLKYEMHYY